MTILSKTLVRLNTIPSTTPPTNFDLPEKTTVSHQRQDIDVAVNIDIEVETHYNPKEL